MTVTHLTEPVSARSLDAAIAAVRDRGLRLSAARRLVLESLFAADGPISAEQIADGVGGRVPRSDLASVYRNLECLEELGLVRHVHIGHRAGLYALAATGDREYLACERCGAHRAVDPALLDPARAALVAATGWTARFTHFPIVGLCPACSSTTPQEATDVRTR
jgi:Fur family ferric uptake transcriptional regulator